MARKRRAAAAGAAGGAALVLGVGACGGPLEDEAGRLGDWTLSTRHVDALNSTEPVFVTTAAGGERLVLTCGGLSRRNPVAMMVQPAPGRRFGSSRHYERSNDRSVRYRSDAGDGTLRGNVRADAVSFYGDGPGNQQAALPRLADSRRLALAFTDLDGRRHALPFRIEGAGDAMRRLRTLCKDTLGYQLTPPDL